MNKIIFTVILLGLIFLFAQFVIIRNSNSVKIKDYQLVKTFPEFEIRKYPDLIVAKSTIANSTYEKTSSQGFRRLAGYIFGGNNEGTKIAMTSPVIMDMNDSVTMSFIMPKSFDKQKAPNPKDSSISIDIRKSQILAVISFDGWANDEKIQTKSEELKELLKKNNITYFGSPIYMGYNPPYQLINRKNEIALRINE